MSTEGLLANYLLPIGQNFNEESFMEFLDNCLLPIMNVYDGYNTRSVIVMGELHKFR